MIKSLECSGNEIKKKSYDELVGIMKGYQKILEIFTSPTPVIQQFGFHNKREYGIK